MLLSAGPSLIFLFAFSPVALHAATPLPPSEAIPSQTCRSSTPFAVPIRNVTLLGTGAVRRGAAISIGTPPQHLAFEISPVTNDTIVFDATNNTCVSHLGTYYTKPNSTFTECHTIYGGLFNKSQSSTWTSANNAKAIGLINPITTFDKDDRTISYGTDTLRPDANLSITGYPWVLSQGTSNDISFFQNELGLGPNSTMLNRLMTDGSLTSNVWSMYDGWTGGDSDFQSDGILVFGGYDEAKTTGDNATIKFNVYPGIHDWTGWDVTVTDIQLKFINGSMASLLETSLIQACRFGIVPSYPAISLSNQLWSNFLSMTGSEQISRSTSPLSWSEEIIAANKAYKGDLVMTLDSGLQITIPNHELIKPYVDIDHNGLEYVRNGSTARLSALANLGSNYSCGVLGKAFLSSAYFMVDNDQKQFTLWQGQPSQEQRLVAVGQPSNCAQSTTSSQSSSSSSLTAGSPSSAISNGAIAGIVVASILIVALPIGIILFLARRKKKFAELARIREEKDLSFDYVYEEPIFQKPELSCDANHQPPQELPPAENSINAAAPCELNSAQDRARELPGIEHSAFEMAKDGVSRTVVELPTSPKTLHSRDLFVKG